MPTGRVDSATRIEKGHFITQSFRKTVSNFAWSNKLTNYITRMNIDVIKITLRGISRRDARDR